MKFPHFLYDTDLYRKLIFHRIFVLFKSKRTLRTNTKTTKNERAMDAIEFLWNINVTEAREITFETQTTYLMVNKCFFNIIQDYFKSRGIRNAIHPHVVLPHHRKWSKLHRYVKIFSMSIKIHSFNKKMQYHFVRSMRK